MESVDIVVLGSGVIGLACALALHDAGHRVKVVARELAEDVLNNAFASPFAGANLLPLSSSEHSIRWEKATYEHWESLVADGIAMYLPTKMYLRHPDEVTDNWGEEVVKDFVRPSPDQVHFTTLSISAPDYILYLTRLLEARNVSFERRSISSIDELQLQDDQILVNATGMGAYSLHGVEDKGVYAVRGQIVLVRAPHIKECTINQQNQSKTEATYIIPRPTGDVVLGGTFDPACSDTLPIQSITERILKSCRALDPRLQTLSDKDIIGARVGFRPARNGGPRVQRQGNIIHAYGFGSTGFQCSKGVADDVVALVQQKF